MRVLRSRVPASPAPLPAPKDGSVSATLLDGKALAARVRSRIADEVAALSEDHGVVPGLAAVLVGDDPASRVYVEMKTRDCRAVGIESRTIELDADVDREELLGIVRDLNDDEAVDGVLVQLPLPDPLEPGPVQEAVAPAKDVDALHPRTVGRLTMGDPTFLPCTPYGILTMLDDADIPTRGARAVVVGRSTLVGRPLSILLGLKGRDATVTVAHSRTRDLEAVCREADILVAAAGRAGLITAAHVKSGAAVVDVGINRDEDGSLVGDVAFDEVVEVAGALTPVPGGVGPMTRAMLLQNTLEAARARRGLDRR